VGLDIISSAAGVDIRYDGIARKHLHEGLHRAMTVGLDNLCDVAGLVTKCDVFARKHPHGERYRAVLRAFTLSVVSLITTPNVMDLPVSVFANICIVPSQWAFTLSMASRPETKWLVLVGGDHHRHD